MFLDITNLIKIILLKHILLNEKNKIPSKKAIAQFFLGAVFLESGLSLL